MSFFSIIELPQPLNNPFFTTRKDPLESVISDPDVDQQIVKIFHDQVQKWDEELKKLGEKATYRPESLTQLDYGLLYFQTGELLAIHNSQQLSYETGSKRTVLGENFRTGQLYAVQTLRSKSQSANLKREFDIAKSWKNITGLLAPIAYIHNPESNFEMMITPKYTTTLAAFIKTSRKISKADFRVICLNSLTGLRHIHENSLAHRDLYPSNLLVLIEKGQTTVNDCVIFDFGKTLRLGNNVMSKTDVTDKALEQFQQKDLTNIRIIMLKVFNLYKLDNKEEIPDFIQFTDFDSAEKILEKAQEYFQAISLDGKRLASECSPIQAKKKLRGH